MVSWNFGTYRKSLDLPRPQRWQGGAADAGDVDDDTNPVPWWLLGVVLVVVVVLGASLGLLAGGSTQAQANTGIGISFSNFVEVELEARLEHVVDALALASAPTGVASPYRISPQVLAKR
eukprot:CAMPEP_0206632746 /NCGR_PEP_ID=MMETSP0325_2-20121206/69077_1 /ASSEMBLY_ACC=CAM_ASM_000347 /TAXON_ID=2866 /ORGANISM="Crypthecodinium cohnii, Strain Seligo" /LENGTH=119 /DNA_ID=CAMNT_0054158305 /DNA_START=1 /DNA_END=360 /DNA_ORIENTATION=-